MGNYTGVISSVGPQCGGVTDRKPIASISDAVVTVEFFRITEDGDIRIYEDNTQVVLN